MQHIHYQNQHLLIENISLADIAARFGTPCYVYSRKIIESNWRNFDTAFKNTPHKICYAVKANSNLNILKLLVQLGSGFDIVSQGELMRVMKAGGDPNKIVFSGVGKKADEMLAALKHDIHCFNIESEPELDRLHEIAAQQDKVARIALRINPNIDAGTHPHIATGLNENKFGIEFSLAIPLMQKLKQMPHLKLIGIACHIGSQIIDIAPFVHAIDRVSEFIDYALEQGFHLEHINIGGGLGIRYQDETPPDVHEYADALQKKCEKYALKIILEPGRAIVANAGILLTRVEYLKHTAHKNFAIVDAAMNDFMRPALYDAWQKILPVALQPQPETLYDVVGPVCESADFLGKNRMLSIHEGDLLALCDAGAYGFSMSSNYNSRPRAAEILVDGDKIQLIRKRETLDELLSHEMINKE